MRGLLLVFDDSGIVTLSADEVTDRAALRQNTLVNISTLKGTDRTYPEKGTNLHKAGVTGLIHDIRSAQHQANFAALDTVTFSRAHEYAEEVVKTLTGLQIVLREIAVGYLKFQAVFAFEEETLTQEVTV